MADDTRYQLWVDGKADNDLTALASSITVTESMRDTSALKLTLAVDLDKGELVFENDPRLQLGSDKPISVVVNLDGEANVIFHGVIVDRRNQMVHGGPGSSIEIACADHRTLMDRNKARRELHGGKVTDIVRAVLNRSPYRFDDVEVEDSPTRLFDSRDEQFVQTTSDLALVRQLAGLASVEFWIDWEVAGDRIRETAHFASQPPRNEGGLLGALGGFAPPIPLLAPPSTPKLMLNTGDGNNSILQFSRQRSGEVPISTGTVARENVHDRRRERTSVPEATQAPLGEALGGSSENVAFVLTAGGVGLANRANAAALNDASWAIIATTTTSAQALCGGLIRPRQVVTVEGAGARDDGEYLVWSVEHTINPADYQLKVELRRNAEGAT